MEKSCSVQPIVDASHLVIFSKNEQLKANDIHNLSCPICHGILTNPIQITSCGHRFCQSCLNATMRADGMTVCPSDGCREVFTSEVVKSDKGCLKEIQALTTLCPKASCPWTGPLNEFMAHTSQCQFVAVKCPQGCGQQLHRSHLEEHMITRCTKRTAFCKYCCSSTFEDSLQVHYASCECHPVTCEFCNQGLLQRRELERHLDADCTEYTMTCPWKKSNCLFKGKRNQMVKHLQEVHSLHAFEEIVSLQKKVSRLQSEKQDLSRKFKLIAERMDSLEKIVKRERVESCDKVEADLEGRRRTPKQPTTEQTFNARISPLHRGFNGTTISLSDSPRSSADKRKDHSPEHGEDVYSDTERDGVGIRASPVQRSLEHLMRTAESHQNKLVHISERVQEVQRNVTHHTLTLNELRLRQDVLDVKSTNGIFVWKIPDVRRRYSEALEGKTISLYSPPFFTSPHGYRMCIRAYLNGDGLGKGTHVSVFFVLMRSENDSLLSWPFKQLVRLTLINQKEKDKSITELFKPDLRSSSFQRPESDMNIASGFPKFTQQVVLRNDAFTRDNIIFIKAEVDLSGLSSQ